MSSTKLSFTQKSIKQAGITVTFQTCTEEAPGSNFGHEQTILSFPRFLPGPSGIFPKWASIIL